MTDALVEAVARALIAGGPQHYDEPTAFHLRQARAALAAIEASGTHVVAPKVPTSKMLGEADSAIPRFEMDENGHRLMGEDGALECWAAMLAARPVDTSNDAFDSAIERDVASGKLDWLIEETKAAEKLPMPARPEQELKGND